MSKQIKRPGKGSGGSKPANPEENPGYAGGLTIGVRTRHLETGASRDMFVCTFPNPVSLWPQAFFREPLRGSRFGCMRNKKTPPGWKARTARQKGVSTTCLNQKR